MRWPAKSSLLVGKWSVRTPIDQPGQSDTYPASLGNQILPGMWMTAPSTAFDTAPALSRGQTALAMRGLSENLGVTFSNDANDANAIHFIPFTSPLRSRELCRRECLFFFVAIEALATKLSRASSLANVYQSKYAWSFQQLAGFLKFADVFDDSYSTATRTGQASPAL